MSEEKIVARGRNCAHKTLKTSYANLITDAIVSAKCNRLTLAEIYDWIADNVAELSDQRNLSSSKGWKNAVRHTLSVNRRFVKVPRTGRPCWWTLTMSDSELTHIKMRNILKLNHSTDKNSNSSKEFRKRSNSEPESLSEIARKHTQRRRATFPSRYPIPSFNPTDKDIEELAKADIIEDDDQLMNCTDLEVNSDETVQLVKCQSDLDDSDECRYILRTVNSAESNPNPNAPKQTVQKVVVTSREGKMCILHIDSPVQLISVITKDASTQTDIEPEIDQALKWPLPLSLFGGDFSFINILSPYHTQYRL